MTDANPKDAAGRAKLNYSYTPSCVQQYAAMAYTEGAIKYGRYNWRATPVYASVYRDAAMRHLERWWNGEWADTVTGVPHLASVLASIGILIDAKQCGTLLDDRPPLNTQFLNDMDLAAGLTKKLGELFADKNPTHYALTACKGFEEVPSAYSHDN